MASSSAREDIVISLRGQSNLACFRTDYHNLPSYLQGVIPGCYIWTGGVSGYDPLEAGVNCNPFDTSPSAVPNNFGVELYLGYHLHRYTGRRIRFIKESFGATGIYEDVGALDWNINSVGELYDQFIGHLNDAKARHVTNGVPYFYDFNYSSQCENDAVSSTQSSVFLQNTRDFIDQLRIDMQNHQLIEIFARIHPSIDGMVFPDKAIISGHQDTLSNDKKVIMLETDHLSLHADSIHFDTDGMLQHSMDLFNVMRKFY